MIEKLIQNELTLKRYRRFKKDRLAVFSVWLLLILGFFSFTAELWANSSPIIMKYHGKIFVPFLVNYHPSEFERDDIFVMDYRSMKFENEDWALWPIVRWDPYESNRNVETYPAPPTKTNWLGTDDRGRDVFARLLYGFRYTMIYAVGTWLCAYFIGVLFGSVFGYVGGKVDLVGMRLIEVIESTPTFFILITIISIFTPNLVVLILFSAFFGWTAIAHYMRAQFLSLRKREYVEAAKAVGSGHLRIVLKHILPNGITPIVTFSPFTIAAGVYALSSLDYLGLGLRPPTPSWGELFSQAQKYFSLAEWLVWSPTVALVLTLTLLINIGNAVRDAFDPK